MKAAQFEAGALFDPDQEDDGKPSQRKTLPEVRPMDLGRAFKRGLIRTRKDKIGAVEIAANSFFAIARMRSGHDGEKKLRKWIDQKGIKIGRKKLIEIVKRWRDENRWIMTVEDTGELLSLSVEDRITHKLWTLGANGETAEERHARRLERQAARAEARKASRPKRETIAEFASAHGVSRVTVHKWIKQGKVVRVKGGTERFTVSRLVKVNIYETESVNPGVPPWEAAGMSRRSWYRHRAKEKAAAGPAQAGTGDPQSPNHPVEQEIIVPIQRAASDIARKDLAASIFRFQGRLAPAIRASAIATAGINRKVAPIAVAAKRLAHAAGGSP